MHHTGIVLSWYCPSILLHVHRSAIWGQTINRADAAGSLTPSLLRPFWGRAQAPIVLPPALARPRPQSAAWRDTHHHARRSSVRGDRDGRQRSDGSDLLGKQGRGDGPAEQARDGGVLGDWDAGRYNGDVSRAIVGEALFRVDQGVCGRRAPRGGIWTNVGATGAIQPKFGFGPYPRAPPHQMVPAAGMVAKFWAAPLRTSGQVLTLAGP